MGAFVAFSIKLTGVNLRSWSANRCWDAFISDKKEEKHHFLALMETSDQTNLSH